MDDTPLDEKALETRREEIVALFKARMARWQHVQAAAFALASIGLAAYIGGALRFPMFLALLVVAAIGSVVSAGVQKAYEEDFEERMLLLRQDFARLKARRSNL